MANYSARDSTHPASRHHSGQNYPPQSMNIEDILEHLPSIAPTRELIEFLCNKILHYEREYDTLKDQLDGYVRISNERLRVESETLSRNERIAALQNALSKLQDSVSVDKERIEKLEFEVETYKLEKNDATQRIQYLMDITEDKEVCNNIVYIFQEAFQLNVSHQLMATKVKENIANKDRTKVKRLQDTRNELDNYTLLKKKTEAMEESFKRQSSLMRERIEALLKDSKVTQQETEQRRKLDERKIQTLASELNGTEHKLKNCLCELLDTKKQLCHVEMWARVHLDKFLRGVEDIIATDGLSKEQFTERIFQLIRTSDAFLQRIELSSSMMDDIENKTNGRRSNHHRDKEPTTIDSTNVRQSQDVHEHDEDVGDVDCEYRRHYKRLAEELQLEKSHRKAYIAPFEKQNDRLIEELKILKARFRRAESYRKLQVEGFLTDVKNLSLKIQNMDMLLSKVLVSRTERGKDEEYLKAVHASTRFSKHVAIEMKNLKVKLYQIERELRNL